MAVIYNASSRNPVPVTLVQGLNGTGSCIVGDAKKGDIVVGMYNISTLGSESGNFESTVSVQGQIQQTSSSNLSGNQYWAYICAQS